MSSVKELQDEEYEVLKSIYEGDDKFTEISSNTFNYKFEDEPSHKSFVVEFVWGDNYPEEPPGINLDLFYNSSLGKYAKERIKSFILEQATPLLNSGMIYSLIEAVKENVDQLLANMVHEANGIEETFGGDVCKFSEAVQSKQIEKKEQLTKAQKRRLLNRQEKGEFPRGWNWVDIIQHLSSTSQKNS